MEGVLLALIARLERIIEAHEIELARLQEEVAATKMDTKEK